MGRNKAHPLAARIKKIMQADQDVGKIAQATPIMIGRALELFLERLCKNASEVAAARKAKTLTCSHVKAYVASDQLMDFLVDTVASAPDLPPEGEAEAPKPKRQRTAEAKPRAPKGEGKRAKKESADGSAAAAAAGGSNPAAPVADEDASEQPPQQQQQQQPSAAATAALPALQQLKQDGGSSSSPTAAQARLGFGGLGAHPFLAARSFGKSGAAAGPKAGSNPGNTQPKSGLGQQQAAAAGAAGAAPAQQQQQGEQQQQAAAPSLLPGMNATLLASFTNQQGQQQEDDYDDDYDS